LDLDFSATRALLAPHSLMMLWGIVLSFIATGVVADSAVSLFNPNPGVSLSAYEAGVRFPVPTNKQNNAREEME